MREDTTTTRVYPFEELSDAGKKSAIENLHDINTDYGWWEYTYDDAATIGLDIAEFNLDRGSFCRGKWTEDAEDTARLIQENHGKTCETRLAAGRFLENITEGRADFDATLDRDYEFERTNEYENLCKEFQRVICEDYLITLQKEYEYLISDGAIIETILANEYEFTADGRIY